MKKLISVCLLLALMLSLGPKAFAEDGTVSYVSGAERFIFLPGSAESPTCLFAEFKNVMPGDTLSNVIEVRNDMKNQTKIRVYVRATGIDGNVDFLKEMHLSVVQRGASKLYDAPADQWMNMSDWVYLGMIYAGGKITLDMQLEVPITMGNEFQKAVGFIDWQFKVEELPVEPDDPKPDTGDYSQPLLWGGLLVGSAVVLMLIVLPMRKKKKDEE